MESIKMKTNFSHLSDDEFSKKFFGVEFEKLFTYPAYYFNMLKESNIRKWIILETFKRKDIRLPINSKHCVNLKKDKDLLLLFKKDYLKVMRVPRCYLFSQGQSFLILNDKDKKKD
jgi:hypothetical protein